jgi:colicin import membrane protein
MSTLSYSEPHKISAGALALVVHAVFFSLLYFSFNWHVKMPENIVVEMFDTLPDPIAEIAPPPQPPPPPPPEPVIKKVEKIPAPKVIEPVAAKKGDIELKEKKKKPVPAKKEEAPAKTLPKQDDKQQKLEAQQKMDQQIAAEQRENERIQARKDKMRAAIDAENQDEVNKYKGLIKDKISRFLIPPPDVQDSAEAIFLVVVLPGGLVMDNVKLVKSSGNAAYDSAAERAIYKAQPLPLPQDAALVRAFRELRLSVKPVNH